MEKALYVGGFPFDVRNETLSKEFLYEKIAKGEQELREGKGIPAEEVFSELEKMHDFFTKRLKFEVFVRYNGYTVYNE